MTNQEGTNQGGDASAVSANGDAKAKAPSSVALRMTPTDARSLLEDLKQRVDALGRFL